MGIRATANLVHGGLLDGSSLLGGDNTPSFLCVRGGLVRVSRIVVGTGSQAFSGSLNHLCAVLSVSGRRR